MLMVISDAATVLTVKHTLQQQQRGLIISFFFAAVSFLLFD